MSEATRWLARVRLSLLCTFLLPLPLVGQSQVLIADLLKDRSFHHQTVVVEGDVLSINFMPEIRDGRSLESFIIGDGSGKVKVLSQAASMLDRGDRVRLVGVFAKEREFAGAMKIVDEIDATRGEIEILRSKRGEENRDRRESGLEAIPTVSVDTPWSMLIDIATLLSAAFAALACLQLLLQRRRFRLGMKLVPLSQRLISEREAGGQMVLVSILRLISTGSVAPRLANSASLKVGKAEVLPRSLRIVGQTGAIDFPVTVNDELSVEVEYSVPASVGEQLEQGYAITFRDHFDKRSFVARVMPGSNAESFLREEDQAVRVSSPVSGESENDPSQKGKERPKARKMRGSRRIAGSGKAGEGGGKTASVPRDSQE